MVKMADLQPPSPYKQVTIGLKMDKPPPYSAAMEHPPTAPGYHMQSNQPLTDKSGPPPQGYPPAQGYPMQGYPPAQGYPPPSGPVYPPGPVPPPGTYIQPPQGATTVVVTNPVMIQYGPQPQPMTCPHCHVLITSRIVGEAGMRTHILALVLCLIGCIPCCLIPYCVDSCQNRNHYCPSCHAFLGSYDADGFRH